MKQREADSLMQQAGQLFVQGEYGEALRASSSALAIYRELRDTQGIATAAENMAGFNYHLGDFGKAVLYSRYSLRLSRHISDKDGMSRAATLIGAGYLFQGKHAEALRWQEQSLKLAQELGDEHGQIRALGNMAQALAAMGRYVEAVERAQEALSRMPADSGVAAAIFYVRLQNVLGSVYRIVGENEEADECFHNGLRKAHEAGDQLGESQSLINLGLGLIMRKRYEEAAGYLERSLEIKERIGDARGRAVAWINLAQCHERLGRDEEALDGLRRTLEIARGIGHKEGEWQALNGIGIVHLKLKRYAEAARYLREALRVAAEVPNNTDLGGIYFDLARLSTATRCYADAADLLLKSVTHAEAVRAHLGPTEDFKISIFERHVVAYRELQWVLVEQGRVEAALEIAERGRARALSEGLSRRVLRREREDVSPLPPPFGEMREIAAAGRTTFVVYSVVAVP